MQRVHFNYVPRAGFRASRSRLPVVPSEPLSRGPCTVPYCDSVTVSGYDDAATRAARDRILQKFIDACFSLPTTSFEEESVLGGDLGGFLVKVRRDICKLWPGQKALEWLVIGPTLTGMQVKVLVGHSRIFEFGAQFDARALACGWRGAWRVSRNEDVDFAEHLALPRQRRASRLDEALSAVDRPQLRDVGRGPCRSPQLHRLLRRAPRMDAERKSSGAAHADRCRWVVALSVRPSWRRRRRETIGPDSPVGMRS